MVGNLHELFFGDKLSTTEKKLNSMDQFLYFLISPISEYGVLTKNEDFSNGTSFGLILRPKSKNGHISGMRSKFLYPMRSYGHKINPKLRPTWTALR